MGGLIEDFVSRYRALGLTGTPFTPDEVHALERRSGVSFPTAYKAFLLVMGREPDPEFVGSDCTIGYLPKLRGWAEELLEECGFPFRLPEKAFVFLMHQGYVFFYFVADGTSEDPPVFSYLERDPGPVQKAERFSAWVELVG